MGDTISLLTGEGYVGHRNRGKSLFFMNLERRNGFKSEDSRQKVLTLRILKC